MGVTSALFTPLYLVLYVLEAAAPAADAEGASAEATKSPDEEPAAEAASEPQPAAEGTGDVDNDPLSTLASAAITAASKTEPEEIKV